jgi:hypothetical protein
MSIPHTVRCRVCAIRPTTSPTKVWNVGAVKHGRNTARRPASEHGAVGPGGIDGSLSRGWWRNRRCFPLHTPRSTNHPSPACPQPTDDQQPRNCETREALWVPETLLISCHLLILVEESTELVLPSDTVGLSWTGEVAVGEQPGREPGAAGGCCSCATRRSVVSLA